MKRRRIGSSGLPPAVFLFAALGLLVLIVPLLGLLIQAPWSNLWNLLSTDQTLTAIRVSLIVSLAAAAGSLIVGVPLAFVLARVEFPGKSILRTLVTVPLVLPPVVTGVALLYGFGNRSIFGRFDLPFSTTGAVLAATMVAMPFLILSVEGALRSVDPRFEQTAASLGARPLYRWWHVGLPMIRPSIVAGTVLAWARALGEFGATITFAGNVPGVTRTLPLEVSTAYTNDPDRAVALSLLMLAVSLIVLISLRDRWVPRR